jgi:hypothetical protein
MKKRTYFNSSVGTTESNITNRTFIAMLHEPSDNINGYDQRNFDNWHKKLGNTTSRKVVISNGKFRTMALGFDTACNRNEYREYLLGGNNAYDWQPCLNQVPKV